MGLLRFLPLVAVSAGCLLGETWRLANRQVSVRFELTSQGQFRLAGLSNLADGDEWRPAATGPAGPFGVMIEDLLLDGSEHYRLVNSSFTPAGRGGRRLTIVLDHQEVPVRIWFEAEVYPGQAVVRYRSRLRNLGSRPFWVTEARLANWSFEDEGRSWRAFQVNQWVKAGKGGNFEPIETAVSPEGTSVEVFSGAHGQHCAWLVARDDANRGLLLGWEFDGRARIRLRHKKSRGALEIFGGPVELFRAVGPGEEFRVPGAFLGLFRGDWDEASYRTHRFVEAALARPAPDPERFPYVMWDSWGYDQQLDERTLRRAADVAARMGIEVFVVDLGWARAIGDWQADAAKFPSGLKALSDYVHSLGMKFGLHFAFTEASPSAPMLRQHPDWFATEQTDYFGARSLCLSHRPVKEWIISEGVRMIREYGVDWILQDGENMVKRCTRQNHTHDPEDSNYSNSVDGLNAVVDAIQKAEPEVLWENCQDGGNMMTFSMVQRYVTSIAADDTGPLTTRQATYGVTFPFSPRYADRYMPGENLDGYITRSYMFGGPWIFMNRIAEWTDRQIDYASGEIALYKRLRPLIRSGRVYHLRNRPAETGSDAIQSMDAASGSSVIFAYREQTRAPQAVVRPRGLEPQRIYQVRFQDSPEQFLSSGDRLMQDGIRVVLAGPKSAEIVYLDPADGR